jgi:tetratricopeptide (TPR) repeat protein
VAESRPAMGPSESPAERRARLFSELCELDEPARRAALGRLAGEDPELAADVERMLDLDRASLGPIEGLRGQVAEAAQRRLLPEEVSAALPPERLGPWRLGEKLGAGGMGEVWAAERVEGGFTQRAAVKLVRSGMASHEIVARFAVERQLLARLDHPAIANLLDGGIAPDGRPWFAMERIDGVPITRFAADRNLDLAARLRLLLAVTDAVDFAHRSLVIHRDLKPSNILVTPGGLPKLLDFGLAKLLEPGFESGVDPHATRTEFRALTPAYAAPEQILGQPVTTATDVYSLGVILYELLTGELPHRRRSSSATVLAADVAVETLERPSQRLRRLEAAQPGGGRRGKRVEGDLDTIVMKALAREGSRRYVSVPAFAADLVAYLEGRPIAARPDSLGYRAGKFIRRHRLGVAAAVLSVLSLVAGLTVSLWQTRRATAAALQAQVEAQRAERVKGFLISVFEQADPTKTQGADMTARRILAEGASRLRTELVDEPEVRADLYDAVARIQSSLGLFEEGLASAETAAAERSRLFGSRSREHAQSLTTLGYALIGQGKLEEAKRQFDTAVATLAGSGDEASTDLARALSGRAQSRLFTNDVAGAREDEKRSVALFTAARGADDPETLEHLSNLAVLETESGSFAAAAEILRGVLARFEKIKGPDSAQALSVALSLATALDTAGDSAAALPLFERVVEGRRRIYGSNHPELADSLVIASLRLSRAGRQEQALAYLAEARATYVPLDHPELASVDNYTGLVLADLGRYDEAELAFGNAVSRFTKERGRGGFLTSTALANLAHVVSERGRPEEGLAMFEEAVANLRALGEFDNPRLVRARINWGGALRLCRRFAEARQVLDAALALTREKLGAGNQRMAEVEVELARLDLDETGSPASAAAIARAGARLAAAEAIAAQKPPGPAFSRRLAAAKAALAEAATAQPRGPAV